jgi:hypothetical protein
LIADGPCLIDTKWRWEAAVKDTKWILDWWISGWHLVLFFSLLDLGLPDYGIVEL